MPDTRTIDQSNAFKGFLGLSSKLRTATTRVHLNTTAAGATNKQVMGAKWFIARTKITSLQIAFDNWYSDSAGHETGSGGTLQNTAAVLYNGSWVPFTWSGATLSPVVANGADGPLSDGAAVNFNPGELVLIRSWGNFSNQVLLTGNAGIALRANGDELRYAATATDNTQTGASFGFGTGNDLLYGPNRVVTMSRTPAFALVGDSRVRGQQEQRGSDATGTLGTDIDGNLGVLARTIGPEFAYCNMGISSETLQGFLTGCTRRIARMKADFDVVINNLSTNDFAASQTAAQVAANVTSFCGLADTLPVFWTTSDPRPSSTGSNDYSSTAVQTVPAWEAERVIFNKRVRGGIIPGLKGFFDTCGAVESSVDSGKYAPPADGGQLSDDGVHLNTKGSLRIQHARAIRPEKLLRVLYQS